MLKVRQGDAGQFKFQAWQDDAKTKGFNLTGATYEGQINGADGAVAVIPNDQFTTLSQAAEPSASGTRGQFTLDFTKEESVNWKVTADEFNPDELLITVTQGDELVATFKADIVVKLGVPKKTR